MTRKPKMKTKALGCAAWRVLSMKVILAIVAMVVLSHIGGGPARAQNSSGGSSSGSGGQSANPFTIMAPGVTGQNGSGAGGFTLQNQGQQETVGQGMNVNQTVSTTVLYPDPKQYVLSAGDLINVRLYGVNDYTTTERISKDGTVELPLIGTMTIVGMTIRAAEETIAERLKIAGMYRNPQILITISESASPLTLTLAGEMHGVFPIQGQRALLDVLGSFGGLPPTAGRIISILRPGVEEPILVDLGTTPKDLAKANVPVFPHDTIFIERAGVVYVLGSFKLTGQFPLQAGRVTLMQLAALSGGPTFSAKYDDLRIIRTVGTERTEVKVDIKRVMYGKDPDPIMQSGDIVFLPPDAFKSIVSNGNFAALVSVASLFLYATR